MNVEGQAKRLTAYVSETDRYEDRPLWEALVERARKAGCAGATVSRGVGGFGACSRHEEKHGLRMSIDLPMAVVVVDESVRITALAEVWSAMINAGLLTIDETCVLKYCGGEPGGLPSTS